MSKLLWWDSQFCFQCQNFGDENLNFVSKCQKYCEAEQNLSHSAKKSVRRLTILSSRWLILGLWFFWDFGYYGTVVILGLRSLGLCISNVTLKLLIEKTSCREKRNTNWAILRNFSPCRLDDDETKNSPPKEIPKSNHSCTNQFWNPIANVSV